MERGKRDGGREEGWREGRGMEGGRMDGGKEDRWREGGQMEGGRGTEGGRASSLFVILCRWVVLIMPLLCGLIVVPSFCVLIVLLLFHIVARHCRMSLG